LIQLEKLPTASGRLMVRDDVVATCLALSRFQLSTDPAQPLGQSSSQSLRIRCWHKGPGARGEGFDIGLDVAGHNRYTTGHGLDHHQGLPLPSAGHHDHICRLKPRNRIRYRSRKSDPRWSVPHQIVKVRAITNQDKLSFWSDL
jgi:hypothetical protein